MVFSCVPHHARCLMVWWRGCRSIATSALIHSAGTRGRYARREKVAPNVVGENQPGQPRGLMIQASGRLV